MSKQDGIGINYIRQIEDERKSRVIVYLTGDRGNIGATIATDAVRPIYDHLLGMEFVGNSKKIIDLFLYSPGGDISVPWRIVSMIREFCDEFNVLIPYKAQSAATLLSLGADKIIMGRKAELGPIDPTLLKIGGDLSEPSEIPVEDINSFLSFIKERASLTDQSAVASMMQPLIAQVRPLTLGKVNRFNSHIRLVARKLLTSRNEKMDVEKINTIIETLTEKIYSHGHGIARKEAKDIGLPVDFPDDHLEGIMWNLYSKYEKELKLLEPFKLDIQLVKKDCEKFEDIIIAVIESAGLMHTFKIDVELIAKRNIPATPHFNLNFSLPIDPTKVSEMDRKAIDKLITELKKDLDTTIYQQLIAQSPIIGTQVKVIPKNWNKDKEVK